MSSGTGQNASVEDQSRLEPEPALTLPLIMVELIAEDQALRQKTATLGTILRTSRVTLKYIYDVNILK